MEQSDNTNEDNIQVLYRRNLVNSCLCALSTYFVDSANLVEIFREENAGTRIFKLDFKFILKKEKIKLKIKLKLK